jgi:hypothetical protein
MEKLQRKRKIFLSNGKGYYLMQSSDEDQSLMRKVIERRKARGQSIARDSYDFIETDQSFEEYFSLLS